MNLRIEDQSKPARRGWKKFAGRFLAILQAQFGLLTILLFLILLVGESIYRNLLPPSGSFKIGGMATLVGLGLLACACGLASAAWARYQKEAFLLADCHYCLTLTDEYLERGVPGLWQQRFQWSILTGFEERKAWFQLKFGEDFFWLWKSELKTEAAIAELRAFLTARVPKAPPVAGGSQAG